MADVKMVKVTIRTLGPHALWLPHVQTRVEAEPKDLEVEDWKLRAFENDGRIVVMDKAAKRAWKAKAVQAGADAKTLKAAQKEADEQRAIDAKKAKADAAAKGEADLRRRKAVAAKANKDAAKTARGNAAADILEDAEKAKAEG